MSTLTGKTLALAVAVAAASALPVGANPSPFDALPASVPQNLPRIQRPLPSPRPRPLPLPTRSCPDPAAQGINFQMIARTNQFRGRVRIGGTIRNQGFTAYTSGSGQQIAYLYEDSRLVAQVPFQNLAPAQEVNLVYERNWDAASPAEGEFPPTYRLLIGYDPDILLDGNLNNDDCHSNNNQLERSGAEINALFR